MADIEIQKNKLIEAILDLKHKERLGLIPKLRIKEMFDNYKIYIEPFQAPFKGDWQDVSKLNHRIDIIIADTINYKCAEFLVNLMIDANREDELRMLLFP